MDDRHSLADLVYRHMLDLIESGELQPGQRLHDLELAETLGYSRTPVREALHRLRDIGVVETSAQRYTRIVEVSAAQMQHCLVVWIALAHTLAQEVVPQLADDDHVKLEELKAEFSSRREERVARQTALAAFRFFELLTSRSNNPELRRAIASVAYVILLGSLELPAWLDVDLVERTLESIVVAARERDVVGVIRAVDDLAGLDVVSLT